MLIANINVVRVSCARSIKLSERLVNRQTGNSEVGSKTCLVVVFDGVMSGREVGRGAVSRCSRPTYVCVIHAAVFAF